MEVACLSQTAVQYSTAMHSAAAPRRSRRFLIRTEYYSTLQ